MERVSNREREFDGSGRFRHDFEKRCVCGCTNGEHAALAHKPCFSCDCPKFRARRMGLRERIETSPRVAELWSETGHRADGRPCWWLRYADGWCSSEGMRGEHEDTLSDLWRRVKESKNA